MANECYGAALDYAARGWAVIPLRPRAKEPATTHGLKDASTDPEQIKRWWRSNPDANVGIVCGSVSGGLVVIDIDIDEESGEDGFETLHEFERVHGELPETVTAETGRGGMHMLYKTADEVRPSTNASKGVDVRGEGSYIVAPPSIHPNGNRYAWENDPDEYAVAPLEGLAREFLDCVKPAKHGEGEHGRVDASEKLKKSGRNNGLFKLASSMQGQGWLDDVITTAVHKQNQLMCEPPLPAGEVDKIIHSVLGYPKGMSEEAKAVQTEAKANGSSTSGHVKIADTLIDEYGACFIDGMPAVRNGGVYKTGWQPINAAMVDIKRNIKSAQRREVREYLTIAAPHKVQSRWTLVGFANGVYDIETTTFRDYCDDDVICNVIPHNYNAEAMDNDEGKAVDALLDRVSCGNEPDRWNIEETVALCMLRTARFGICPVLIGDGANGKSTVLAMIRALIGVENISALQPREVNARFQGARLIGKTANLGDDISSEFLTADECAGIKKVATGDLIYSDVKGAEGVEFVPYATMVFSANEFPRLGDSTPGMYRRLFPIEFNARFTREDPDYDPNILDKVLSEPAMEHLICLALIAAGRLRDNRGMTPNAASERILEAIREDNNSVLMWTNTDSVSVESVVHRAASEVYRDYRLWCMDSNVKQLGVKKFNKALRALWGIEPGPPEHDKVNGTRKTVRYFEKVQK